MITLKVIILLIISYLWGSVAWGYIIGKSKGIDIREHGSCNVGSTNITRTLGKKYGILCFILDFFKGFIPVICVMTFIPYIFNLSSNIIGVAVIIVVIGTIAGHIFPFYLKFKGGKGIASGAGALIAITPLAVICGLIVWVFTFKHSRYVSLASIFAAITVAALTIVFSSIGWYHVSESLQYFVVLLAVFAIVKHISNIKRLINGTENRFEKKTK